MSTEKKATEAAAIVDRYCKATGLSDLSWHERELRDAIDRFAARARAEAFEEAARECGQRSAEWHSVGCNDSRDEAYCCEHVIRALAAKERAQQNTVSPTFGEANTQQEKS